MAGYVVTAGYVTVETAVPGGRAAIDIPRGAALPPDVPDEAVSVLLARGDLAAGAESAPGPEPEPAPDAVPDGTVPDVLAWVGDDPARAAQAREFEESKGPKARATLLSALAQIEASTGA